MQGNVHARTITFVAIMAGLLGITFGIVGLVEYVHQNALWGGSPGAGAWFFAQASWWLNLAGTGLFVRLAVAALSRRKKIEPELSGD
jgi:hypothetical protein